MNGQNSIDQSWLKVVKIRFSYNDRSKIDHFILRYIKVSKPRYDYSKKTYNIQYIQFFFFYKVEFFDKFLNRNGLKSLIDIINNLIIMYALTPMQILIEYNQVLI